MSTLKSMSEFQTSEIQTRLPVSKPHRQAAALEVLEALRSPQNLVGAPVKGSGGDGGRGAIPTGLLAAGTWGKAIATLSQVRLKLC